MSTNFGSLANRTLGSRAAHAFSRLLVSGGIGAVTSAAACGGLAERKGADLVVEKERPGPNACGGRTELASVPGQSCGSGCSAWACDGFDAVKCEAAGSVNACGTCGPLPVEVCNGRDDNCNGVIDEGCVDRIGERPLSDLILVGNQAAYTETSDYRDRKSTTTVGLLDMPSGTRKTFTVPTNVYQVAFDGTFFAWNTGGGEFALREARTGVEKRIPGGSVSTSPPTLHDGHLAFVKAAFGSSFLVVRDLSGATAVEFPLDTQITSDRIALSNEWAVYTEYSANATTSLRAVHLPDGRKVSPSAGVVGSHRSPAIVGSRLVWECQSSSSGSCGIYSMDLDADIQAPVKLAESGVAPTLTQSAVCWASDALDSFGPSVVVLDLAKNQQTRVAGGVRCSISDDYVGWLSPKYQSGALGGYFQARKSSNP